MRNLHLPLSLQNTGDHHRNPDSNKLGKWLPSISWCGRMLPQRATRKQNGRASNGTITNKNGWCGNLKETLAGDCSNVSAFWCVLVVVQARSGDLQCWHTLPEHAAGKGPTRNSHGQMSEVGKPDAMKEEITQNTGIGFCWWGLILMMLISMSECLSTKKVVTSWLVLKGR